MHTLKSNVFQLITMEHKKNDLEKEMLKPISKANTNLDKELQEWEVESTKDGQDSQGNG